jgi:hypothetical protein
MVLNLVHRVMLLIENSLIILYLTSFFEEGSILFGLLKKGRIMYTMLPLHVL